MAILSFSAQISQQAFVNLLAFCVMCGRLKHQVTFLYIGLNCTVALLMDVLREILSDSNDKGYGGQVDVPTKRG